MRKIMAILCIFQFVMVFQGPSQPFRSDRAFRDSLLNAMPREDRVMQANAYLDTAQLLWDTLPEIAFSYIMTAQKVAISEENCTLKGKARFIFGQYFARKRDFASAQKYLLDALAISTNCDDTLGIFKSLAQIGDLSLILSNYPKAIEYFEKGLLLARRYGNLKEQARFQNLVAYSFHQKGDTSAAMAGYRNALAIFQLIGDKQSITEVKVNIGSLLMSQPNYEKALAYFNALLTDLNATDSLLLSNIYTRIGHSHQQLKHYRESLYYNKLALNLRKYQKPSDYYISSLINVSGDYYLLNMSDSGDYYMNMGIELATRYNHKKFIENGYRHLYTYYESRGDYKKALSYFQKYTTINEAIEHERNEGNILIYEKNQSLQQIQASASLLEKQHRIQNLNDGNQRLQYLFVRLMTVAAGAMVLIFIILFVYNWLVRNRMRRLNTKLVHEIKEREITENQLRDREQQYRFLSENSMDFITQYDLDKKRVYASPAAITVYGYSPEEILLKSPYDLTIPDYHAYAETKLKEMIETRSPRRFSYQALKKDGSVFWIESVLNPLFNPNSGEFSGLVGVTRDIQHQKQKEFEIMETTKQSENLLKEIHHRVKNNFAILVSLINMQLSQCSNEEVIKSLTNLQLRIRSMALVHEMLYRSKDFQKISFHEYLRSVTAVIAGTYNRHDIELIFHADETTMNIETLIPLGLIVNELVSNVYKHAFPDQPKGTLWVTFKKEPGSTSCLLTIKDNGIGLPAFAMTDTVTTMGLQIVHLLCRQIEAELAITNEPGATFNISFFQE